MQHFDIHMKQAQFYMQRKMFSEALLEYKSVLKEFPNAIEPMDLMSKAYEAMGKIDQAYQSLNKIVDLYQDDTPLPIRFRLFEMSKNYLFWDNLDRDISFLLKDEVLMTGLLNPFYISAFLPLTNIQRKKALERFVKKTQFLQFKICSYSFQNRPLKPLKLKLGFLCADVRPHPTGFVMGEFFERLNREKFDVYLYNLHPELNTLPSKRIYQTVEHIVEVDKLSDQAIAQRIFDDKIDVLIDMNGFTSFNRLGVMTYQPAPAQCTFLGFINTLGGVPGIDYHLTDRYSLLPGQEHDFSEKLKFLEPTQWVIDHKIEQPQGSPLKHHLGFDDEDIVLCCFNNTYKLTPNYFDLWARIVKRVPKAKLWFYGASDVFEKNIIKEFQKRGVEPDKIKMTGFINHTEHLSRYKVADLLLDTEIYGAHTTAMEALFMGCPVITCEGNTVVSRVCGSILTALNTPELICKNIQEYEEKVVYLCTHINNLKQLKEKVLQNAKTASLFDMEKFTESFEKNCDEMYFECMNRWKKE